MRFTRITPRQTPERKLSRVQAFDAQGVTLRYPARSWSGVRRSDGVVVLAMREGDVQVYAEGYRCLLWSPVVEGATEWVDRPSKLERLEHCRIAALHGGAEGLVVRGEAAQVDCNAVLALHVEKRGAVYWATWGSADRMLERPLGLDARVAA